MVPKSNPRLVIVLALDIEVGSGETLESRQLPCKSPNPEVPLLEVRARKIPVSGGFLNSLNSLPGYQSRTRRR